MLWGVMRLGVEQLGRRGRTDRGTLTGCELGEEIRVLMPFIVCPGFIRFEGVVE
jgi:hypothetical protein